MITLQYCGAFCHTSAWSSCGYTCVPLILKPPPTSLPTHPSRLSQSTGPGCPPDASGSHWSCILHVVMHMFHPYSLRSSLSFSHCSHEMKRPFMYSKGDTDIKCLLISWLQVTILNDFGAQENKICYCFLFFPFYLPGSGRTGCHDLSFLNVEFQASFSVSSLTLI